MDKIYTLAVTSYIVPKGRIMSILGFFLIVGSFGRTKSKRNKILLKKLSAKLRYIFCTISLYII